MINKPNRSDIETERDVKLFVGRFYSRIREDAVLGLIFDDIANVDWVEHIPTMCDFWETVLFQKPGYKGNPLLPHIRLARQMKSEHNAELQQSDFDRWIRLFHSTLDELFSGPRTEQAKRGASRMAAHMVSAIADVSQPVSITVPDSESTSRGYSFNQYNSSASNGN